MRKQHPSGLIHYGPVWEPRPALGKSFALCRPQQQPGCTLSRDAAMVDCEECLRELRDNAEEGT